MVDFVGWSLVSRRLVVSGVIVALGLLGMVVVSPPARAAVSTEWTFESGLDGWTVTSGAFAKLRTDRGFEHNSPSKPYSKQGTWFLSTLEAADDEADDSQTGQVESPSFTATTGVVSLLVGGGSGTNTYVGVADSDGTVLARASGTDSEKMEWRAFNVAPYLGKTLHLVLVDEATGGWGHLTVDDVRVNDVGTAYDFEDGSAQGWTVTSGSFAKLQTDRGFEHNHPSKPYSKQGKWFMSTLESSTDQADDGQVGTVESPSFVLVRPVISMLVGGGFGADTYVAVVDDDGSVVTTRRGGNSETMFRYDVGLQRYLGHRLRLRIVDSSTSAWGHITLDDVSINLPPDPRAGRDTPWPGDKIQNLFDNNCVTAGWAVGDPVVTKPCTDANHYLQVWLRLIEDGWVKLYSAQTGNCLAIEDTGDAQMRACSDLTTRLRTIFESGSDYFVMQLPSGRYVNSRTAQPDDRVSTQSSPFVTAEWVLRRSTYTSELRLESGTTLDMGSVKASDPTSANRARSVKSIVLRNVGTSDVSVSVSRWPTDVTGIALLEPSLPAQTVVVRPGQTISQLIEFVPDHVGTYTTQLSYVLAGGTFGRTVAIAISGVGTG